MVGFMPHLLTEKEFIEKAEQSRDFLKRQIHLSPSHYLKEKFKDQQLIKEFVGSRVRTENKRVGRILEQKLNAA